MDIDEDLLTAPPAELDDTDLVEAHETVARLRGSIEACDMARREAQSATVDESGVVTRCRRALRVLRGEDPIDTPESDLEELAELADENRDLLDDRLKQLQDALVDDSGASRGFY